MSLVNDDLQTTESVEHTLVPIPENARTSTVAHQFWIWCGANVAPINWVLGALGINLGLSLLQTILVLVIGNLIGMAVFGFFVLMGQRTAVSQMVLSRSAFGRRGAYFPALLQGLLAVGWCAINTWIILDLVVALFAKLGFNGGLVFKIIVAIVIMGLQVWLAAVGFRAIARFERWTVPITLVVLAAMTIVAWTSSGVHWGYSGAGLHGTALWSSVTTLMTAIGIGWGITWFAYASDYSRFVSRSVSPVKLYFGSVLGQFIPTVWLGIFGATLATISQKVDPGQLVVEAFGWLAIPVIFLVIHGPIATNVLNIYSCSLSALTLDWNIDRRKLSYGVGILALAFNIYLIVNGDFASSLDAWLSGLVTWVAPWATIMLIHFFWEKKSNIDVDSLFAPPKTGTLPDISWPAIIAFVLGIVATWSFEYAVPSFLQGPGAIALGGIDLSWLSGSIVAGLVYWIAISIQRRPAPVALATK
ncbi:MAG: permease for cytosine/purines uracil thiamine allantoin [Glaciihabitans sp.]|nr:permease for cytosine/purines uracil thiamine allantoin [Glaciihabitans sp.]